MIRFSDDPEVADQQMEAIIFYLTTIGYVDGMFSGRERTFVRDYIRKLVFHRVRASKPDADPNLRQELTDRFTQHFIEVLERVDNHIGSIVQDSGHFEREGHDPTLAKIKLRCYEIFRSLNTATQRELLTVGDDLLRSDSTVDPSEVSFRNEFVKLLESGRRTARESRPSQRYRERRSSVEVSTEIFLPPEPDPFAETLQRQFDLNPNTTSRSVNEDRDLIRKVVDYNRRVRENGTGRLASARSMLDFEGQAPFLDGHVHVVPAQHPSYEITVVGDLNGCFGNLRATILQSQFLRKVEAFQASPESSPLPMMVFLGNFSLLGEHITDRVLQAAIQLKFSAPEHVYLLKGSHEDEAAMGKEARKQTNDLLRGACEDFATLFQEMAHTVVFEDILFVHGGVPKQDTFRTRFETLASLNDPLIRKEMLWSDPSRVDAVPPELQEQSLRFPFGRLQAFQFLDHLECQVLVRGHEKIASGFCQNYDDENVKLFTVFSCGGADNPDLPPDSVYRRVEPMALTIRWENGASTFSPWKIRYET